MHPYLRYSMVPRPSRTPAALLLSSLLLAALIPSASPGRVPGSGIARRPHDAELNFPGGRMTVEAWVQPAATGRWMRIISKYGDSSPEKRGWELSLDDQLRPTFRIVPWSPEADAPWLGLTGPEALPVGAWSHVAVTVDAPGDRMALWVNGRQAVERPFPHDRFQENPAQDLYLGTFAERDIHLFEGLIDEVRLTAGIVEFGGGAPAAPYRGDEPGTLALYAFDEQHDGTLADASASGQRPLHLLDGDAPALAASREGFGKALRFPGEPTMEDSYAFRRLPPLPAPTLEELEAIGRTWQERWPDRLRFEEAGRVSGDLPMHVFTVTDFGRTDEDKEIVFMAAPHCGGEVSGGTALLAFIEWLAGDAPEAARLRARQKAVFVPVANPYAYRRGAANRWHHDPAWSWTPQGARNPDENPEGLLLQRLIDDLRPDVVVDSHGTSLEGQYMGEFVGTSGFSLLLNTFQGSLVREMAAAAGAAGFPQHLGAESHEKILSWTEVPGAEGKFYVYPGGPAISMPIYAYLAAHSIPLTMESGGWTGSAVARLRRLMEIGGERWSTEYYPGYPNRRIGTPAAWMQWLAAYGTTAEQRRASRVELWNRQNSLVTFRSYPDRSGFVCFGVVTQPSRARALFAGRKRGMTTIPLGRWLANLASAFPEADADAIRRELEESGAMPSMWFAGDPEAPDAEPLNHGLALRTLIPYPDPILRSVRLNGHDVPESETDGYVLWRGDGGAWLQVQIPPGRHGPLAVLTVQYDGNQPREWGFDPARVLP